MKRFYIGRESCDAAAAADLARVTGRCGVPFSHEREALLKQLSVSISVGKPEHLRFLQGNNNKVHSQRLKNESLKYCYEWS